MSSVPGPVTDVSALAVRPGRHLRKPEQLATEEPLEIRLGGLGQEPVAIAVTMRTPGHDFELAAGFCRTEALLPNDCGVAAIGYCQSAAPDQRRNVVSVVADGLVAPAPRRSFVTTSSCGICGKGSIDEVEVACPVLADRTAVRASLISSLPDRLRTAQRVFSRTGGLHASGLFTSAGDLVVAREDVGRHNALDKVVGHMMLTRIGVPPGAVLMVSGRVSFEIVQKAAMATIGMVAAVSAPSSLAVQGAERLGVTIAGFVRGGTFNVYSHPERVIFD
jgi:FdhD protein